jgi:Domain of unknown function (DUF4326)
MSISVTESDFIHRSIHNRSGEILIVWRNTGEKAIQLYREKLLASPLLLSQLHELKDKTLGCWYKPDKCHGDVLVELVDKMSLNI